MTTSTYAVQQLLLWLEDNIDCGSTLHFDNEGQVTSQQVLSALRECLTPPAQLAEHHQNVSMLLAQTLLLQRVSAPNDEAQETDLLASIDNKTDGQQFVVPSMSDSDIEFTYHFDVKGTLWGLLILNVVTSTYQAVYLHPNLCNE